MRYACAPATAASSPFPIPAREAGRTASRTFAEPCAPTPTWRLYSFPFGGTIDEAASPTGEPYANLPNAGKFEKSLRSELLLPAQGAELGGGARRRGSALWPREARHSGDAGEVGGDGPADHRSQGQAGHGFEGQANRAECVSARWAGRPASSWASSRVRRERQERLPSTRRPRRSSTPTAPTPNSAPRPPRSAARAPASPATIRERQELQCEAGPHGGSDRIRRRQALGADSRAIALARPISGRRTASSGPASWPVKARRKG